MPEEFTVKIAGEAGQGMQTIGLVVSKLFKRAGYSVFANQDNMSRIRGGNNFFQLRISGSPVHSLRKYIDILVSLDGKSHKIFKKELSKNGVIILDRKSFNISDQDGSFLDVPLSEMAKSAGGSDLYINSVATGSLASIFGLPLELAEAVLKEEFSQKGDEVIKNNMAAAKAGYNHANANFKRETFRLKARQPRSTMLIDGNSAITIGAVRAGCKFYSAYPMSPSTPIMNSMAQYSRKFNIVVEQAEDEIAAINMIIGASYAGVRSMLGTSGGGFALMVEGLSLAGMTETPIVAVDCQRPAPATGFPTRTEQADLNFLIHAGHGEFARVIYAPGTAEQAFYLTVKALNIADKYQIPVLIMSDQHLSESYWETDMFNVAKASVARYIISKEDSKNVRNYKRYQLTKNGISPRAIPSWIDDPVYADSDEHTEEGHITEAADVRTKMVEKRLYRKMEGLIKEIEKPAAFNIDGAKMVIVGFGSTYGAMKEASEKLNIGFIHLSQVWPFPSDELNRLLAGRKNVITVENNAGAQLAGLMKREAGIKVNGSILKYDGRPFDIDSLIEDIKERIK